MFSVLVHGIHKKKTLGSVKVSHALVTEILFSSVSTTS